MIKTLANTTRGAAHRDAGARLFRMYLPASTLLCVGFLLSACVSPATLVPVPKPQQDAAPQSNLDVISRLQRMPDPQVTKVLQGKRGNGPVYTVWGKSYRVMDSALGYTQQGTASWYGTKFHGRETSSGEVFDIYKLTAAHKHLPLPSYVRVTNLNNGKHTVVRVNDRGPFHDDRIIDLSYAAAVKLDFHDKGTSPVRIEVLTPDQGPRAYMVQAGAYSNLAGADRSQKALQTLTGYKGVVVKTSADDFYRVRIGPVPAAQIAQLQALLHASSYGKPKLIPAPLGQLTPTGNPPGGH